MSRTVSFRASEELDEFLEQEAKLRMTTKSTVAQMLLAERVRELKDEREDDSDDSSDATQSDGQPDQSLPEVFSEHIDKWYRPDGQSQFAVRMPGDEDTKYYNTQQGAADRLKDEYGE